MALNIVQVATINNIFNLKNAKILKLFQDVNWKSLGFVLLFWQN